VKVLLPRSKKNLEFDSKGEYDKRQWTEIARESGPAARTGDLVQITKVDIEDDKIVLQINGGFKGGRKWYQGVQIGMGGNTAPVSTNNDSNAPGGTSIAILFHKPLEPIKAQEIKKMLAPVLDFEKRSATQTYSESLPPETLTAYASANLSAERSILPLAGPDFTVSVLRQATVFGLSRRMRFDLVINLMTLNAVQKNKIFIMGGGQQWRPIIHVADTARGFICILEADPALVNGEVFNVGDTNLQVHSLANIVRENLPFPVEMEVIPDDPDKRTYNVSFDKINRVLGFKTKLSPADGVREIYEALKLGRTGPYPNTYTVKWYKQILDAHALINRVMLNGRLI